MGTDRISYRTICCIIITPLFLVALATFIKINFTAAKNATFFDVAGSPPPENVTRIYIDAFGSIYPSSGIDPAFAMSERHDGSLFNAMNDSSTELCEAEMQLSEAKILCDSIRSRNWFGAQDQLWRSAASTILNYSNADSGNVDLVFLIHGFNNSSSEAKTNYTAARSFIQKFRPAERRQYFIEIYWDGFIADGLRFDAWRKAQASGPLVGFKLRSLMHNIHSGLGKIEDDSVRIRFLTHSSGAFVVGSIFGDPIAALPLLQNPSDNNPQTETDFEYFYRYRNNLNPNNQNSITSFKDLRIGMLAPATSDWTFAGNEKYNAGFLSSNAIVLFSIQPDDEALTKWILGPDFQNTGSTGLGVDSENHYCKDLWRNSDLASRNIRFLGYDFSRTPEEYGDATSTHAFDIYLRQAAEDSNFMRDLFEENGSMRNVDQTSLCV